MSNAAEYIGSPWQATSRRLGLALQAFGGAFYDWNLASDRITWSDGAAATLGIDTVERIVTGAGFQAQIGPDDRPRRALALTRHLDEGRPFDCIYKLRRQDGRFEWVHERAVAEPASPGELPRLVGILHLVTGAKLQQEQLERLANQDDLTGRLNASGLKRELEDMLRAAEAGGAYPGLLVANIDNLGTINDVHGYDVADMVIIEVGRRIRATLRAGDRLGRVAGNQFGILLDGNAEAGMAAAADEILRAVRNRAIETTAGPIAVSVSIGGVATGVQASSFRDAIGCAEEALERAKRAGRDRFARYSLSPEKAEGRRATLGTGDKVLRALRDYRLRLAFQPIVDARSGEPVLYECLLRMLDEAGNIVPAGRFMPAVEKLGLARVIDRHALALALRELDRHPGIRLAVNISAVSAADPTALTELVGLVEAHRTVADRLTVEITETMAMTDFEESARFATLLKQLGCSVAVDDFGAGHTSFRHLKALAIDMVKIDGQFVKGVSRNPDNQLFVDTLLKLAEGLGLRSVAECVETRADAEVLSVRGVNLLQGHFFGKPVLEPPWTAAAPEARLSDALGQARG